MITEFTTVVTEQDGIDLFQDLISNLDKEEETKQFLKQVYAVYITNDYSEGMTKFFELLLAPNPSCDEALWNKLYALTFTALLVE